MPEKTHDPEATVAADWLQNNAHLCQVSTKRLSAEKVRPGRAIKWDFSLKKSLGFSKDHIHIVMSCKATAEGKSEKSLGVIEAEVVGNYQIGEDHPHIPPSGAMLFGDEVGIRDVFPYLRQALDLMAMQVGLGRVKLDPPKPSNAVDRQDSSHSRDSAPVEGSS
ncbi:hypothetical protein ACIRP5_29180 [Streptomyces sp. NPDC101221]|uniref:hypothetical protein n=1 Tax=Streptomyces sp. NPDC101221 TaxID=3366132 RepID=UPI0037F6FBFC